MRSIPSRTWILLAAWAVLFSLPALAHKPVVIDGGPTTAETAHEIADIDLSQVGYHEATTAAPEMWFTFEATAGEPLFFQLGVPEIARYEGLRPAAVLLGPGLPEVGVPFQVPEGYGGTVYGTAGVEPVVFDEEFTGTISWQFPAVETPLPVSGRYYLVGYLPGGAEGKFWMAIGKREQFGLSDILTLPSVLFQVRAFHEVGPVGGILFWFLAGLVLILLWLFRTLLGFLLA